MQAPVTHAGKYRLSRQLRAVQKKQQPDGKAGYPFKYDGHLALARKNAGDGNGKNQSQSEIIRHKTRASHGEPIKNKCMIGIRSECAGKTGTAQV